MTGIPCCQGSHMSHSWHSSEQEKRTHREEEQLECDDVTRVCVAGSYLSELTVCLERLCNTLLHIAVDLMSVWGLQKHLPADQQSRPPSQRKQSCSINTNSHWYDWHAH